MNTTSAPGAGRAVGRAFALGGVLLLAVVVWAALSRAPERPTVILISIDGFRWDYIERTETPNLDRLSASGVRAERLVPVFPTLTFPNHYSMVTGLFPVNHGIVANTMYDPVFNASFRLSDREAVEDGRWWEGEPIWVTAETQGQIAASFFWPGSEAEIKGHRPTYWKRFDETIPAPERVEQVLAWLDLEEDERPSFVTMYFEHVDDVNHDVDPESSPEIGAAIRKVDAFLGLLLGGLDARGITETIDIIVVSDHGITARTPDRAILLDDYIDLRTAGIIDWHPVAALRPEASEIDNVFNALHGAHPNLQVYRKGDTPDRYRYNDHRRIAPIIAIADEGWSITSRSYFDRNRKRFGFGSHGYDHELRSMGALFVASGPSFKSGLTVPPFQNIHLYELMCSVLGLDPAPNDGTLDAVRIMLAD